MFPSASFQYVLYGMNFMTEMNPTAKRTDREAGMQARAMFLENAKYAQRLASSMPTNRELINKIYKFGLQKI
jgi:hypothetical protein